MTSSRLGKDKKAEDNVIKDLRNLFRLKKLIDDTAIKDIRNLFRLKNENEAIKVWIIWEIKKLFEHGEEGYDKPVRVGNFWSNNYFGYQS